MVNKHLRISSKSKQSVSFSDTFSIKAKCKIHKEILATFTKLVRKSMIQSSPYPQPSAWDFYMARGNLIYCPTCHRIHPLDT